MEVCEPRYPRYPSDKSIPGQDFYSYKDKEQGTAESNKIVRKHFISQEFGVQSLEFQK